MEQTNKIGEIATNILFQHKVLDANGEYVTDIYTIEEGSYKKYEKALQGAFFVAIIKYLAIGMLIGMLIGFFTATQANPLVKSEIVKYSSSKERAVILLSLAQIESSFRPYVKGAALEFGLFQLHPRFFVIKTGSIKEQVQIAEKHLTFLIKHCTMHISICWNLGVKGAKELKEPTKFVYYKKFKQAKAKYEKELENIRPLTPPFNKIAVN